VKRVKIPYNKIVVGKVFQIFLGRCEVVVAAMDGEKRVTCFDGIGMFIVVELWLFVNLAWEELNFFVFRSYLQFLICHSSLLLCKAYLMLKGVRREWREREGEWREREGGERKR
jgi:hypothetical protein